MLNTSVRTPLPGTGRPFSVQEKATSPTEDRPVNLPNRSLLDRAEPLSVDIPEVKKEEGSKAIPEALRSDFRDYWRGTEDHLSADRSSVPAEVRAN
jgi:hypothetical protein